MNRDFNKLGIDLRIVENPIDPTDLIKTIITTTNNNKHSSLEDNIEHDPFYVVDLEDICNKHINWITLLPRVEPHYAIKCNGDPMLLKLLAFLGAGFDCASKNEIQTILDLGVSPDRIIYANPCKQASYIRYAYKNGVNTMTFDNSNELYKIKENHPNAKIVLRIITNDTNAVCKFSMKFGADMPTSYKLIDLAMKLDLDLIGISFHVGSGQMSPAAFTEAIYNARILFDYAQNEHGLKMNLLDLGGGYPGSSDSAELFVDIAKEINNSLDTHFPSSENVRIIAEPGRYYACSAFTLCANVIAKRTIDAESNVAKSFMYYINDGVYASFNCIFYDHIDVFQPILMKNDLKSDAELYTSSIWGPTCDGLDCISKSMTLPELDIGDFMSFKNMGAYTLAGATPFNGIPLARSIYMATTTTWKTIKHAFLKQESSTVVTSSATTEQQQYASTLAAAAALQCAILQLTQQCVNNGDSADSYSCGVETNCIVADTLEEFNINNDNDNCVITC